MFNKRKNKTGILVNRRRDINVLDCFFDPDNERFTFSFTDEFKQYSIENEKTDWKPTEYELQKPFGKDKLD